MARRYSHHGSSSEGAAPLSDSCARPARDELYVPRVNDPLARPREVASSRRTAGRESPFLSDSSGGDGSYDSYDSDCSSNYYEGGAHSP